MEKPSHHELERPEYIPGAEHRGDTLETATERRIRRKQYEKLFQKHSEGLAIIDAHGTFFQINKRLAKMVGLDKKDVPPCVGWHEIQELELLFSDPTLWKLTLKRGHLRNYETSYLKRDGTELRLLVHCTLLTGVADGNHTIVLSVADITRRKRKEEHAERSIRLLTAYCACLEHELTEKIREIQLSKDSTSAHISNLEKAHDLTKTVVARVQEQKRDLQNRIHHNLSLTVYPLIEHLRDARMSPSSAHMLDVLEFNIKHITSQFGVKLLGHQAKLSPREIQVCHMIRAGKDSREIAASLGLTYETVIVHRKNIRKKLGLNKKRQNLAGYIREHM
jgi:PAS domain S-box-containing protein